MSTYLFAGYVLLFTIATVACVVSLTQLSYIHDHDVRTGLLALLVTSGSWAGAHVGYLVVPGELGKVAFYVTGLIMGFAAVGAWLYFCSAYSGRTYHRLRRYRYLAVAIFLVFIFIKVTNPLHSLYFTTEVVSEPFYHLAVRHGTIHWVAMGLSYALATVGFFMLFERFISVGFNTTPLAILAGFAALPVVGNLLGIIHPGLLDMTYEPVGVAIFAVGVLFIYIDQFQAVNLADSTDVPVIFLDADYRIRDYNRRAKALFPALEGAHDMPLSSVSEQLAEGVSVEGYVIEKQTDDTPRYYLVSATPMTVGETTSGYILTLSNVTEKEQYRKQLEEKTTKLEQFASVISHDLRNPLTVAKGYVELAQQDQGDIDDNLRRIEEAHSHMEELITDLLTLAREGASIEDTQATSVSAIIERCWRGVETADASIINEADLRIQADSDRLQQLIENLFRNAIEHGGSNVTITVGPLPDGFFIEDDGDGIPADIRDEIFEFGYSTAEQGTGFGLSIVQEIVDGHGWEIAATEGTDGGARFEITNVELVD